MTEFKSFSRWSALLFSLAGRREKERMGRAGVLLRSQMAVAGPTDVPVGASGYIPCSSRSSTYALHLRLHSAASKQRMMFTLKDPIGFTITSEQVAGFRSEPLWSLHSRLWFSSTVDWRYDWTMFLLSTAQQQRPITPD